jgi:proline iminopeptidase
MEIVVNALRLHWREAGSGSPLVLLHPGPGLDGSIFLPFLEPLAERYRLIALDLPGNGRSDTGEPDDWTLASCADTVAAFANALGLREYTLLGHSFGSFAALTHLARHPGAAARVVASCGAASETWLHTMDDRVATLEPAALREQVREAFDRESRVQTPEDCRSVWTDEMPFFVADPQGDALGRLTDALERVVFQTAIYTTEGPDETYDVRAELARSETPVLAIGGAHDLSIPPEASEEIALLAPQGALAIIEGAGHFPFAEQPGAYLSALRDWLD